MMLMCCCCCVLPSCFRPFLLPRRRKNKPRGKSVLWERLHHRSRVDVWTPKYLLFLYQRLRGPTKPTATLLSRPSKCQPGTI